MVLNTGLLTLQVCIYLYAWIWCLTSHFSWICPCLKSPLFPFPLQSLSFNGLLRAFGFPGMSIDCKHSRKCFPILSAVISPGTNNLSFSLKCARHLGLILFPSSLTSPWALVSVLPASGKGYKSDISIFWACGKENEMISTVGSTVMVKSLRKQNLASQEGRGEIQLKKRKQNYFDFKEYWLKESNKHQGLGSFKSL